MSGSDSVPESIAAIKSVLTGVGMGATLVGAGMALPIGIVAGTLAAGLVVLQSLLEQEAAATDAAEKARVQAQLAVLLQAGLADASQYQYDLTVFLQQDFRAVVGPILEETAATHAELGPLVGRIDQLSHELYTLAQLNKARAVLDVQLPHGFVRLDEYLWVNGGADDNRERRLTPALFRLDGAYWCDFAADVVFLRTETVQVYEHLQDPAHDRRIALIEGVPATGKTTMARHAGFLLAGAGRPVYISRLDVLFNSWDSKLANMRAFLQSVSELVAGVGKEQANEPSAYPVLIVEDIHSVGHETAVNFIEELSRFLPPGVDFILCTRPSEQSNSISGAKQTISAQASERSTYLQTWHLKSGPEASVEALARHLWAKRWHLQNHEMPFDLPDGAVTQLSKESGGNLWLVSWMLAGHNGDPQTIFLRSMGTAEARQYLMGTAARAGLHQIEATYAGRPFIPGIMLAVSCFSRWDHFADRFWIADLLAIRGAPDRQCVLDTIRRLEEVGELAADGNSLRVPHREVAALYLEAADETDAAKYIIDCVTASLEQRPAQWQALVTDLRTATKDDHGAFRYREIGEVEAAVLTSALLCGAAAHATGLWGTWRMSRALQEQLAKATGEVRASLLAGGLCSCMSSEGERRRGAHDALQKLVHQGVLSTEEILAVADAVRDRPDSGTPAEVVRAVGSIVRNDEQAIVWLRARWQDAAPMDDLQGQVEAAAALAWRGSASPEQWASIYKALCSDDPPERAMWVAWTFPRKAWVRPLRRILAASREREGRLGIVRYAWAAQSRCYDSAAIARELAADTDEMHQRELLLSGNLVQAIPSPIVVQLLLDQVRVGEVTPLEDVRLWWALLRLGELWQPEALAGFSTPPLALPSHAFDALQMVLCENTGEKDLYIGLAGHVKEAALAVAADIDPPGLVGLLQRALKDDRNSCVDDAAERLGWWEAESALPALIEVLANHRQDWVRQEAGRAIGHIGGLAAVEALLSWPIRFDRPDGTHPLSREMLHALGNAAVDAVCVRALLTRLWDADLDPEMEWAIATGINDWAWREWDRRRIGSGNTDDEATEVATEIHRLLRDHPPQDDHAVCELLNALSASPDPTPSLSVVEEYAGSANAVFATEAVATLAWTQPEAGTRWLELARDIDRAGLPPEEHPLARVAGALLLRETLAADGLRPGEAMELASHWLEHGPMSRLSLLAEHDPEPAHAVIRQLAASLQLQYEGSENLVYAVTHVAPALLAELLSADEYQSWYEWNVQEFALMIADAFEPSWHQSVVESVIGFLCWSLSHEKTRTRGAAAQTLLLVSPETLIAAADELSTASDWQCRAAALEAAALLDDERFAAAIEGGLRDEDSRVRDNTVWARERRRHWQAQQVAIQRISEAGSVREAFRWWQCLRACGDDHALLKLQNIRHVEGLRPAVRHWLKKVHEDVEKAWKKRAKDHDDKLKWTDRP